MTNVATGPVWRGKVTPNLHHLDGRNPVFFFLNRVQFETHGSVCPIVTLIKGRNYDFQTGRGLERQNRLSVEAVRRS
jgi:hypothetical protein